MGSTKPGSRMSGPREVVRAPKSTLGSAITSAVTGFALSFANRARTADRTAAALSSERTTSCCMALALLPAAGDTA